MTTEKVAKYKFQGMAMLSETVWKVGCGMFIMCLMTASLFRFNFFTPHAFLILSVTMIPLGLGGCYFSSTQYHKEVVVLTKFGKSKYFSSVHVIIVVILTIIPFLVATHDDENILKGNKAYEITFFISYCLVFAYAFFLTWQIRKHSSLREN